MTHSAIDDIIQAYVRANLSPKPPERALVEKRYDELQSILEGQTFQTGSYARHTSTTPVNDLDVFYILPESILKKIAEAKISPSELDIDDILTTLAEALRKQYGTAARIVAQPHSVGIFFGREDEFSIDVVPAQPTSGGLFWVPESSRLSIKKRRALYASANSASLHWIKSDPRGYILHATNLDLRTTGRFRRVVKIVKKWKDRCENHNASFRLKSFHLEVIVTELFKNKPTASCLEMLHDTFEILPLAVLCPQYPDRADASKFIDDYIGDLSDSQRELVCSETSRAQKIVGQVASAETNALVLKGIEELLRMNTVALPIGGPAISTPRKSQAHSMPYAN